MHISYMIFGDMYWYDIANEESERSQRTPAAGSRRQSAPGNGNGEVSTTPKLSWPP